MVSPFRYDIVSASSSSSGSTPIPAWPTTRPRCWPARRRSPTGVVRHLRHAGGAGPGGAAAPSAPTTSRCCGRGIWRRFDPRRPISAASSCAPSRWGSAPRTGSCSPSGRSSRRLPPARAVPAPRHRHRAAGGYDVLDTSRTRSTTRAPAPGPPADLVSYLAFLASGYGVGVPGRSTSCVRPWLAPARSPGRARKRAGRGPAALGAVAEEEVP